MRLRLSDLDIKVHKVVAETGSVTVPTSADDTETISYEGSATFFIEGAAKIGLMDIAPGKDSPFIPGDIDDDLLLPAFTAFVAQQGAVPYARVINNTLVGRGGDLFDGNGTGDVGIVVEDNASPTIMNNIISNFGVGIRSDFSANDSAQQRPTFLGNDFPIDQNAFGPANFEDNDQIFLPTAATDSSDSELPEFSLPNATSTKTSSASSRSSARGRRS